MAIVEQISDAIKGQRTQAFLSDGIDNVLFDVVISDNEADTLQVTRHTIESGSDITDHVNTKPKKFSIEAVLTDDDLDLLNPGSFFNKTIGERLDVIKLWIEDKAILTYYGHTKDIEDVVIESVGRKKTLATGEGISISLKIAKVNIVESVQTDVTVATTRKKGKTAKQTDTNPGNATQGAQNKSWAKTLFG